MATITRTTSAKINALGTSEIYLRVSVSQDIKFRLKSGIYIAPDRLRNGAIVYPRGVTKESVALHEIEDRLQQLESDIITYCLDNPKEEITKDKLEEIVDRFHHPERYKSDSHSFFDLYDMFMQSKKTSQVAKGVIKQALHRFELYQQRTTKGKKYRLTVDGFSSTDFAMFENYFSKEREILMLHPDICEKYPIRNRKTRNRSDNSVASLMITLKSFFNWCYNNDYMENKPPKYETKKPHYATPYYLTLEERDLIADFDFSNYPNACLYRDAFVLQCHLGCRYSDLIRLQHSNIKGNTIEYIAKKTKDHSSNIVRVPLTKRAIQMIELHKEDNAPYLLPKITLTIYESYIKKILKLCGITRNVTVINGTTGLDEQRPINEVAGSHLARRTFVGNLYKLVKDPNLIASMSGHVEGSKAFARYRQIDDEMKREIIDLIE